MTPADFRTLTADQIASYPPLLQALWQEAQGDWQGAHELAQDVDTPEGAWVHAYLHRREGDLANAAYWYRRAGKAVARGAQAEEWQSLMQHLLEQKGQDL